MGRKILMVGLGGTGCKAVARVRERIIQERKASEDAKYFADIQFVGIDTDQGGKGFYKTLPMVWTARSATVSDLLVGRDSWKEWFPEGNNFLMARNCLAGAGQIRVLSRICLEDTIERENTIDAPLDALNTAIRNLQKTDGDLQPPEVVVMIISSFAGGTGSGIFIEMALYLRHLLLKEMHCNTAIIRGLFALPDIYTSTLDDSQMIESVYANAYASLKELCAINRLFSGNDALAQDVRMRYGDIFDSQADRDEKGKLPITKLPYNAIFFVDNANQNGQTLPSLAAYEELIAEIAYMQIYSPMAPNLLSHEDNRIRKMILSKGQEIYAAAGCSKIVYPHDDIVEYCVKRMMADTLERDWLYFDKLFRRDFDDAKKRRRTERGYPLPRRAEHFVNAVNQRLNQTTADFAYLRDDIVIAHDDDMAQPETYRQDLFLDALKNHIKKQVKGKEAQNTAIRAAATAADIEISGKKRDDLIGQITNSERKLLEFVKTVDAQLESIRGSIIYDMLPESMVGNTNAEEFSLHKLLTNSEGKTVHPVSARYLLYAVQLSMLNQLAAAQKETGRLEKQIHNHLGMDWDETKAGRQTAAQAVPRWGKKAYTAGYQEAREKCYSNIVKYAENKLMQEVVEAGLDRISLLIHQLELFFDCLDDYMGEQQREADKLERLHETAQGITTFVQASSHAKIRAYHQVTGMHAESMEALYESILTELYSAALRSEKQRADAALFSDEERKAAEEKLRKEMSNTIGVVFKDGVEQTFRKLILEDPTDAVNIDVIRAIDKECSDLLQKHAYADDKEPLRKLLSSARAHAFPMLIYDRNAMGISPRTIWGINDTAVQKLSQDALAYFGGEIVQSSRYTRYEVSCYQAIYGLALTDILKFRDSGSEPGVYFKYYESLRRKMIQSDGSFEHALTPHTDYHWIDRSSLPMISDERNQQEIGQAARVFWLGWLYQHILIRTVAGKKGVYWWSADQHGNLKYRPLMLQGQPVNPRRFPDIYKALTQDMFATEQLDTALKAAYQKDCTVRAYTEKALLKTDNPLLTAMIDAPDGRGRQKGTNPLTVLGSMLGDDVFAEAEDRDQTVMNAFLKIIGDLRVTRDEGRQMLKQLIYRYSAFHTNPAWRQREPQWLDSWKADADAISEESQGNDALDSAGMAPEDAD